jgi:hypothetical protein
MLVELLNMKPTDYKRFLNFLRKHECHVPFERFRSARLRPRSMPDEEFAPPRLVEAATPVLEDVLPLRKDLSALGTERRWSDARRVSSG